MTCLLLTKDLLVSSQVGAAAGQDVAVKTVSSLEALSEFARSEAIELVLVDLSTAGTDLDQAVRSLKQNPATAPAIVAFGPHVHAEKLAAAARAGCDEVLSRGQLHSRLADILAKYTG